MANQNILPIYKNVYGGEEFNYGNFDHRLKMQKAVYLLTEMGVPVGNYGFRWYLHGPYSQDLHDDMYDMCCVSSRDDSEVEILAEYDKRLGRLRDVISFEVKDRYSDSNWMECIASIHYLRNNILPYNATMEQVLNELESRKKHLKRRNINEIAFEKAEALFEL